MNKKISTLIGIAFFGLTSLSANAAIIGLYDWGVNIDGTASEIGLMGNPIPGNVDVSGFNLLTGLGRIDISFSGAGAHNALAFFDHEIDEAINTFFNENGFGIGALAAGQSAEIDEPGFVFGDIYSNFLNNSLDNLNGVPPGSEDDVSMAIGWDFTLAADETAIASFFTSLTNDSGGLFTLEQHDPDSSPAGAQGGTSIFFWSDLDIQGPAGLPEPGTLGLALFGMLSVFGLRRRKMQ